MKSTLNILGTVYSKINPIMASKITGKVYIGDAPDNDQGENITLNCLTNPIDYVQKGIMNVNIELMGIEKGVPNQIRFSEILTDLLPLLDDVDIWNEGTTVQVRIDDDKGIFKSNEQEGKYFYNLRVAYSAL